MKIIAVANNYIEHNKELRVENPKAPVLFMKPDSALLKNNKPFFIPSFSNEIHYELELLVRINRLGKNIATRFAHRYYDEIGLGIDFTARDLQQELRAAGRPWEICKAFDGSAVVGEFLKVEELLSLDAIPFRLEKNAELVQSGNSSDMIFSINELIAHISKFFTLKIGDIIFTGTPSGVGPVSINDKLEGYIYDKKMFSFFVK